MKITVTVPQIKAGVDDSYEVTVDRDSAIKAGASTLGATKVGMHWYYVADETSEVYRLTSREVARFGAGKLDSRGVNYSLWCSETGHLIRKPSARIKAALGI